MADEPIEDVQSESPSEAPLTEAENVDAAETNTLAELRESVVRLESALTAHLEHHVEAEHQHDYAPSQHEHDLAPEIAVLIEADHELQREEQRPRRSSWLHRPIFNRGD